MLLGRSVITWIIIIALAVGMFLVAQWGIPAALIAIFGTAPPLLICNILAFFIAVGVAYGGYTRGAVVA